MSPKRCSAESPAAILSFHSHSDRSFLDDRELALLSGALRNDGIANDLVLVVVDEKMAAGDDNEIEKRWIQTLAGYDPIVFERVWSAELIRRLRAQLPDKTVIGLRGEHELLDSDSADVFCNGEPIQLLGAAIQWLRGERDRPPEGLMVSCGGSWSAAADSIALPQRSFPYEPNLRPVIINPEALPPTRTFSIVGNEGCPYQADARANPLYAGTEIPAEYGRGCAFCVTGNHYVGRPNPDTAATVMEQLRHVRAAAPELTLLVLKDQNPFGYLTEVIEQCEADGLTGFTLLLETRAEWFLRNSARFARALEVSRRIGVRLAPFLVGIENFSQPELDRFNKGITVAVNIEFLETLWRWREQYGEAMDLSHAAFGFILWTPWTTMDDLEANLAAIRRTNFDRLRGSLLLSRARLYPDTALYYLAQRDGLLAEGFECEGDNASQRYGYYPSRPWRHVHREVAHLAALATELAERSQNRDVVNLLEALLATFRSAGADWDAITADDVWQRYEQATARREDVAAMGPASEALRRRFAALVQPLSLEGDFAGGWRFGELSAAPGRVQIELRHDQEQKLVIELGTRGSGPHYQRSRHYDIRAMGRQLSGPQRQALIQLSQVIVANDR